MDPITLVIFILALCGAGFSFISAASYRSVPGWIFVVIAVIELIVLLPGGPF